MKFLIPITLLLSLGFSYADDFVDKFNILKQAGDDAAIVEFLKEAAVDEADNPDYYANAGNYWWGVGKSVTVRAIREGDYTLDPNDFSIIDPKTGKKVGSIGKAGDVDPEIPKRTVKLLSEGVKRFPERADIALGLAHVQKELGLKKGCVETLTALLAHAKTKPKTLKWTLGGKLPQPAKTFLPESIQVYSSALFKMDTPATDKLCLELLDAIIETYPNHPYAYNLKGALSDATGNQKEALKMLEMAHKLAPKDSLILANVARAHVKLGDTKKAIAAFEKALELEKNPRSRARTEAELKKLRQKVNDSPEEK